MNVISNAMAILNLDSSKEPVLYALQDMVEQEFCDYCNRADIPLEANGVILQMLLVQYNRLGAQGLSSQSYSGVSESYLDGYGDNIRKQLNRYRKLQVI